MDNLNLKEIAMNEAQDSEMKKALAADKQTQDFSHNFELDSTSSGGPSQEDSVKPSEQNCNSSGESIPGQDVLARKTKDIPEQLDEWPYKFDMADVADEMANTIKKHCVLTPEETDAIALWIVASYAIEAFQIFPRLALISPEMRCGKSTTMHVISALCRDGLQVSNLTPAILFRLADAFEVTLLIDEADTFIKDGDPELIGLVNSGHNKSTATTLRCAGDDHKPRAFRTWMPMVLASIGELPRTIMDRSITINLRRKMRGEGVTRVSGDIEERLCPLRRKTLTWCIASFRKLQDKPIDPPDKGNDRALDNWIPLFTIAEYIGGDWPTRCNRAYSSLTTETELPLQTHLLADINRVFKQHTELKISTEELIGKLCADTEAPWLTCNYGKKLTPRFMAKLLKPYSITPKTMRWGETTKRGYEREQFQDAFERYLS